MTFQETKWLKLDRDWPLYPMVTSCRDFYHGGARFEVTRVWLMPAGDARWLTPLKYAEDTRVCGVFIVLQDGDVDVPYGRPFRFCPFCGVEIEIIWKEASK